MESQITFYSKQNLCVKDQWYQIHLFLTLLPLAWVFLNDTWRISFNVINGCLFSSFPRLGETNFPPGHFFRPNTREELCVFSGLSSRVTFRNFTLDRSSSDISIFVGPLSEFLLSLSDYTKLKKALNSFVNILNYHCCKHLIYVRLREIVQF